MPQQPTMQDRAPATPKFSLKFVFGTTVSRCYGCGGQIHNPPNLPQEEIVLVCRDFREYRDRSTGQKNCTDYPVNVHFHMKAACVFARYRAFCTNDLNVSKEFIPFLRKEHYDTLRHEFGWVPLQ